MPVAARVDRLRVATHGGRGVVTARALVEDALRTSGAGEGRGLLVVRKVVAGQVSGDRRAKVSATVSAALARARANAVRPDAPGADGAEAVLFRDAAEPYVLYAQAVAARSPRQSAWFFRSLFGRLPAQTTAPARQLAVLLTRAAGEPFGRALIAQIVAVLPEQVLDVLTCLSLQEIALIEPVLVEGASGTVAEASSVKVPGPVRVALERTPTALRNAATRLVLSDGADEPRGRLAVALTLHLGGLARLTPELIRQATRVLAAPPSDIPEPEAHTPNAPPARHMEHPTPSGGKQPPRPDAEKAPEPGHTLDPQGSRHPLKQPPPTSFEAPATEHDIPHADADAVVDLRQDQMDDAAGTAEPGLRKQDHLSTNQTATVQGEPANAPSAGHLPEAGVESDASPALLDAERSASSERGTPSAYAGAVLLVRLLSSVLPELVSSPDGMTLDVGRRLMARSLLRAGATAGDPAARCLTSLGPEVEIPHLAQLDATGGLTLWSAKRTLVLRPILGQPGWRALTCTKGRMVFAIWRGRAPASVRFALHGRAVQRGTGMATPLPRLITTAELSMRRAVREVTGAPMRRLVARSGWLAASSTHLDVTFDSGLVDFAIRRAGLDSNPGWCAWFGRVVTIHYDYGGSDAR